MTDADIATLSEGLWYEDRLPVRWDETGEAPTAAQSLGAGNSGEQFLRHLGVLDEHRTDADEDGQLSHDIQRLEFKVDLLLELVGRLAGRDIVLPPAVAVRLGADRMQWTTAPADAPGEGRLLRVELFLYPRLPTPLELFGAVESVVTVPDGVRVTVRYAGMGEGLRNALEKLIFRQHRRLVAQARQAARRTDGQASAREGE